MIAVATKALRALSAMPTPSRVELPLMNETKKPPVWMKPIASTKPASAERRQANRRARDSRRVIALGRNRGSHGA